MSPPFNSYSEVHTGSRSSATTSQAPHPLQRQPPAPLLPVFDCGCAKCSIAKGEQMANIYYTMSPWAGSGLLRRGCGGRGRSAVSVARCSLRLTCKVSDCVGDAAKTAPRSIVSTLQFTLTRGWFCQFLEADLKTVLPRKSPGRYLAGTSLESNMRN